ncbi:hypothetical protein BC629DRAFT_1529229, partial [Irpex lacteus]
IWCGWPWHVSAQSSICWRRFLVSVLIVRTRRSEAIEILRLWNACESIPPMAAASTTVSGCNDVRTYKKGHTRVVLGIETCRLLGPQSVSEFRNLQEPIRGKGRDDTYAASCNRQYQYV